MKVKIIFTLNNFEFLSNPRQTVENLKSTPIDMLRINLSKEKEAKRISFLLEKWLKGRNEFDLILDLPLPNAKRRIYFNSIEGNVMSICSNRLYHLICGTSVTDDSLFILKNEAFYVGEKIIIGDGEGVFTIADVAKDGYRIRAEQSFALINGKSINRIYDNINSVCFYREIVQQINPTAIILSFVENAEQVFEIKKVMMPDVKIISKIETKSGIDNIEEIAEASDGIMLGRGDLAIYTKLDEFYLNQSVVIHASQKHNKPIYVATDVLESLTSKMLPSRSELIDLAVLLQADVNGLVFSARISDFNRVKSIIDQM